MCLVCVCVRVSARVRECEVCECACVCVRVRGRMCHVHDATCCAYDSVYVCAHVREVEDNHFRVSDARPCVCVCLQILSSRPRGLAQVVLLTAELTRINHQVRDSGKCDKELIISSMPLCVCVSV